MKCVLGVGGTIIMYAHLWTAHVWKVEWVYRANITHGSYNLRARKSLRFTTLSDLTDFPTFTDPQCWSLLLQVKLRFKKKTKQNTCETLESDAGVHHQTRPVQMKPFQSWHLGAGQAGGGFQIPNLFGHCAFANQMTPSRWLLKNLQASSSPHGSQALPDDSNFP